MSLNVQGFINVNYLIMKKQFLNLGKALSKAEQKQVFGGTPPPPGLTPCKYKTKEECDINGGFWGMSVDGYWYCTCF